MKEEVRKNFEKGDNSKYDRSLCKEFYRIYQHSFGDNEILAYIYHFACWVYYFWDIQCGFLFNAGVFLLSSAELGQRVKKAWLLQGEGPMGLGVGTRPLWAVFSVEF